MVTILRAAEQPIALMADWISAAFDQAERKQLASLKFDNPDEAVSLEDATEDEVLTFTTRRRTGSSSKINRIGSPSNSGSKHPSDSSLDRKASQHSPPLARLAVEKDGNARRGWDVEFVDNTELLRRRRAGLEAELRTDSFRRNSSDEKQYKGEKMYDQ